NETFPHFPERILLKPFIGLIISPKTSFVFLLSPVLELLTSLLARRWVISPNTIPPKEVLMRSFMDGGSDSPAISQTKLPETVATVDGNRLYAFVLNELKYKLP